MRRGNYFVTKATTKNEDRERERISVYFIVFYLVPCVIWQSVAMRERRRRTGAVTGQRWQQEILCARRTQNNTTTTTFLLKRSLCVAARPRMCSMWDFFPCQFRSLANINFQQIFVLLAVFFFFVVFVFPILNLL